MSDFIRTISRLMIGAMLLALPTSAVAQQSINLTAIDGYAPRAVWVKEFIEFYIPEVDKRLATTGKYKINWTQAWSGQIAKPGGVFSAMEQGLGDIAIITVPFYSDRLPFNVLPFNMPFTNSDPGLITQVMDDLAKKIPEFQQQFEKANQILLTNYSTFDTYHVFTSKQISKPADLKGVRINAAGDNMRYLEPIGAIGVRGSLAEYYNNLRTGVTSGAIMFLDGAMSFKLNEVANYMIDIDFGTASNKSLTVNKNTWAKLPEEVKKALQEVAFELRDRHARLALEDAVRARKAFLAAGGTIIEVSEKDRREWAQSLPNLAQEWASSTEKEGLPGKAYLKAMMDGLRAGGAKPLRDWDKE
jgi:C4-dicarboxylate-binding protein DctP